MTTDVIDFKIRTDTFGNDGDYVNKNDLIQRIIQGKIPTYEIINDNIRYNFDIDAYCDKKCFTMDIAAIIEEQAEKYISQALHEYSGIEPIIQYSTSHTDNYDDTRAKYSVRYYVTNLYDTRQNVKSFVQYLNGVLIQMGDEEQIRDYIELQDGKLFDDSVYSSNRKMRCNNTSKPNENRPLVLKTGTIEGTIINDISNCVNVHFVRPDMTSYTKSTNCPYNDFNFKSIGILDQNLDEIEFYVDNHVFKNHVGEQQYTKWIVLGGMFLSIMTPENAYKYWERVTLLDGTDNKKEEYEKQFVSLKMLMEDPIMAMNSIRKNIRKEFPTIVQQWKDKTDTHECLLKAQLKAIKDKKLEEKRLEKEQKQIELERKKRFREQEKEAKEKLKEAKEKLQEMKKNENSNLKVANNDLEASNIIYDEIKDNLIYSNETFYFKENNLWTTNFDNLKGSILKYVMNSKIYKTNDKGDAIDFVQNRKFTKTVLDTAIEHKNLDWYNKIFHSSLGKILFNNGYYDFKVNKFYNIDDELFDKSIIFIEKINYNWESNFTEKEHDYINQIREKLFYTPFGVDVGNYYILNLARGLAGDCMKRCLFGIGSSNTGKSIITSALKSTCGGYFGDFNAVNIAYKPNSSGDEAQKLRWLMLLQSKRIIASNEIQMGIEIDGNMIKKISNGGLDAITARGHCGNETSFKIGFLPIIFANDIDKISPKDDAVINRIRAIHYEKVCVENPTNEFEIKMDVHLNDEIETPLFRRAFMKIIMEAYHEFHSNNRIEIEPEGIKKAKIDIFGANVTIISSFTEEFEITDNENDYVPSSEIVKWLNDKKCKVSITKFGLELNKYVKLNNLQNVVSKLKKIKGKPKQCWIGVKSIEEIEEDNN